LLDDCACEGTWAAKEETTNKAGKNLRLFIRTLFICAVGCQNLSLRRSEYRFSTDSQNCPGGVDYL